MRRSVPALNRKSNRVTCLSNTVTLLRNLIMLPRTRVGKASTPSRNSTRHTERQAHENVLQSPLSRLIAACSTTMTTAADEETRSPSQSHDTTRCREVTTPHTRTSEREKNTSSNDDELLHATSAVRPLACPLVQQLTLSGAGLAQRSPT